jgi:two-component system response regulator HydG
LLGQSIRAFRASQSSAPDRLFAHRGGSRAKPRDCPGLLLLVRRAPPLRERREDLPDLARHFLRRFAARDGKEIEDFAPEALRLLESYPWPGNVRELEHVVERAVALDRKGRIDVEVLPEALRRAGPRPHQTLEELEREYIRRVLAETQGSRQQTAAILGIDRKTLYRKILRYGLEGESEPRG